jgi:hypothetical protein
MKARAILEDYAREQASRLGRFSRRIVDCRVLLEPNDASVLRVVVEITVPGERLVASHESEPQPLVNPPDAPAPVPEHRWLHAMHESFEAAGRLLQDYAGRRRTRSRQPSRPPMPEAPRRRGAVHGVEPWKP